MLAALKSSFTLTLVLVKQKSFNAKTHMHIAREKIKKSLREFMNGTLKISGTFQESFNLNSVVWGPKI